MMGAKQMTLYGGDPQSAEPVPFGMHSLNPKPDGTTVGIRVGVGTNGVGVAVGACVAVSEGAGVAVAAVVPEVVGRGVAVPVVALAVTAVAALAEAEGLGEATGVAVEVALDNGITVPGVMPGVSLPVAAAWFVPSSSPRVTNTASRRKPRTAATPPAKIATLRGIPGSIGPGGRSARTPGVRGR